MTEVLPAVLEAPPGQPAVGQIGRILLATDLGDVSAAAERTAIELAARFRASLVILSVIDPARLRLPNGPFFARVDQVRARREIAAGALVDRARAAGVRTSFLIWQGEPGESILEVAEAEQVDAIVLGSHGRGRIGRFLLGSVSARVTHAARWPVFIARDDEVHRHDPADGDPSGE